ncbi:aminotransferase class III-fold pyridoxal phosphate-dependent enzyme [Methanobacterium sp.]|uniref:aspartate aminotransferase family protein n=1 Tax=Methanobacterium sp. TaxID=2164 RepID=UPI0025FFF456|nr:aminotransferase class III-fold pyridoxal phosphate-dependent enzyme [Methanobacterium sp.]MBI5459416.1 aminotransferase class III-fold pyridoxal phosphate-dependent enzyme [Methanobacterium sp.]
MAETRDTFQIEDDNYALFANKTKVSIEKGEGVYVYGEDGEKYIDFTAGWGVTSIGHANPVITQALCDQSKKIIQNPNSGATYSPARSKLLSLMQEILPENLTRIFFSNSGAEANDAAIKLARKATGKLNIISTEKSFHGRTISTVSATGQNVHRSRFNPLIPNHIFVPYNNIPAIEKVIGNDVAAVIVEPIQGEGGINVPDPDYLENLSNLCMENNVLLIVDEIQTGFYRTGPVFMSNNVKVDILTMAKGIAGGFPFGAFAFTEEIQDKLGIGDHGGTYCGNPLGCAVAYSVIKYMLNNKLWENVEYVGESSIAELKELKKEYPNIIKDVRGKGLLIAVELANDNAAATINSKCLDDGLILNVTQGNIIRMFPALNISIEEMEEGLNIFKNALDEFKDQ